MANETRLIVEQTGQTVIVQSGSGGTFADEARVFRNQAQQFAQAASADADQTALDRIATGQDRLQTGLDAEATAADRAATDLDAQATAADRIQTGLDRVQTGLDVVATGADRVEVNNIFNSILTTISAEGQVVGTYAEAQSMLTFFPVGSVVAVIADETFGGRKTYYRVEDYVGQPSIVLDFISGADSLGAVDGPSVSADFVSNTFSLFELSGNDGGSFSSGFFLTRIGSDSINLVGEPLDSSSPGILGDISMSGLNFDFHNGTQWVRLTGSTF